MIYKFAKTALSESEIIKKDSLRLKMDYCQKSNSLCSPDSIYI